MVLVTNDGNFSHSKAGLACTASLHLKVKPQAVFGCVGVLSHTDVVVQTVVRWLNTLKVACFKVAAEHEAAG